MPNLRAKMLAQVFQHSIEFGVGNTCSAYHTFVYFVGFELFVHYNHKRLRFFQELFSSCGEFQ